MRRITAADAAELERLEHSDEVGEREPADIERYYRILYLPFFRDRASAAALQLDFNRNTARHI